MHALLSLRPTKMYLWDRSNLDPAIIPNLAAKIEQEGNLRCEYHTT